MKIAQIALPVPLLQIFDYLIPFKIKPVIGSRVKVVFGHRIMIGIVVNLCKNSALDPLKLKYINTILDQESLFFPGLWNMLLFSANYYHYPLGLMLTNSLPNILKKGKEKKYQFLYKKKKYVAIIQKTFLHYIKKKILFYI
ncbi:primosomal protein N' family DNA-binding protein [Candidatus Tachikawaea gelatinosa]|uniref:primosomal protein N' family DNA-binding protein n=1 Tax=Candidatus Tachikawaea gelatinosa TaxID=1410383 RepID=UPI00059793F4|nr:hypothetical protein [Candidatus Tachikawaea gelatinosa]